MSEIIKISFLLFLDNLFIKTLSLLGEMYCITDDSITKLKFFFF